MLKMILGTDWVAIRDRMLSGVAQDVKEEKTGRILMVPELISHDMERRLCAAAGDTASRFAEVLSFTRLARRVSDATGCAMEATLDNGGRLVAMAAAARQLHSRLKAYASVETKPEFLSQLVDAVDEFKRCCISPEDLRFASAQTQGTLAQKLEELSLLLEAYDSLCARGKKDPRDQMSWLLERLEDGDFAEKHVFYIDGFPDYTRQHMAILEHLIRRSPSVTVGLNCDRVASEHLAFEKAGDTAKQILRLAKDAGVEVQIELLEDRQDSLGYMSRALFQGTVPKTVPGLKVLRAQSAHEEVLAAAEQVMDLVRQGCRYREIAVVCADMGAYQDLLELVFHRCRIPLYRSGTEDILRNTVISTVLSALEAALEGLEQRPTLRYLRSVLSPLDADACDEVENYAVLWGIRGNRWLEPWKKHPGGLNELWTETAEEQLAKLNQSRELAVIPLMHLSQSFRDAVNLAGQVQALLDFLEEIGLAGQLSALAQELDGAGDSRGAQILNQLWEILLSALEQMRDILGQTAWEPEVFTRLLTLLLSQYDVGTIPPVLDAVTAGPVSAMRCQQVKHLLVLGACEGALPGYGGSAGLLTDQERVALRQMGVPLTGGAMEGIQAEFAEIYGVFCGAQESVTVNYPGGQPSYVYRRLADMCGGEQTIAPTLGAALADPVEAGAYLAAMDGAEAARTLSLEEAYRQAKARQAYEIGGMERQTVSALYGKRLNLSASQIDRQAECRMSYFLKYGLRAKERKEATVDPAEFGSFVHAVLEHTAGQVMEQGGFQKVSLEETLEMASKFADQYASERFDQLDSQRLAYLFRRNRRELEMVVTELWRELKESKFIPKLMELDFSEQGRMDAIAISSETMEAVLRGFVDRVDVYQENGRNYFRVVDYKTGKKDFDYCDVFNGVGLQMLLYLFALQRAGQSLLDGASVGAGVQYFPARVPLMTADGRLSDEEAEALRKKEWVRKGLLLEDEDALAAMGDMDKLCCTVKKDGTLSGDLASRAQMKLLERYVFTLLSRMVEDIASGNVTPNPYTRGTSHNACTYCPYGAVCKEKDGPGRRNYKSMTAQRFWDEVEREVEHHG